MSLLLSAKNLAAWGFRVFPLARLSKVPLIKDFPHQATAELRQIEDWWSVEPNANIGISTEDLLVIDIDDKGEKHGSQEFERLRAEGKTFPDTFTQLTPTGGRHLIYKVDEPVKQGTDVLAQGIDIRGRGGYVVAAGSILRAGRYEAIARPIARAPDWLIAACGRAPERPAFESEIPEGVDPEKAEARAINYLTHDAPLALEGHHGDQTTFLVAAHVKDLGVPALACFELMAEHWNPRCEPPWDEEQLATKVDNAYHYGSEAPGSLAPEVQFEPVSKDEASLHPFDVINREFAYVIGESSDHIIQETRDAHGQFHLKHLDIDAFHRYMASYLMTLGDKSVPVTRLWIVSKRRRTYDGVCFLPGKKAPDKFYNLWKGFTVDPYAEGEEVPDFAKRALDAFLEHALLNVCGGDESLFRWLMAYFAHLIQKPWEKPLVALVLKGGKGVGKNALLERVGFLLGDHFAVVSNKRYLIGNFNSFLENKLLLVLDEAFWSGDKASEGVLKDLITGGYHTIERKGREPYRVENRLRVAILGNEDWLVPASADERRYVVFSVGSGRKQDISFFETMRDGMERGGYRLLLRHLMSIDFSGIRVNQPPQTQGLLEQKAESLEPLYKWWLDSLHEGRLLGFDLGNGWPSEITKDRFRAAFHLYLREHSIRGFSSAYSATAITRKLVQCLPSLHISRIREDGRRPWAYRFPTLAQARTEWEQHVGHKLEWPPEDEEEERKELFS